MKIVIVHNSVLPAFKYGGTQRVIWALGKELSAMGHDVTFLAAHGSMCPFARVIEIDPAKEISLQVPDYADVVHFNDPIELHDFSKPYIITIHGNEILGVPDHNSVFVSRNHAERFGCNSFVWNGMDWDEYGKVDLTKPRDRYHFLGKAAWRVKNVAGAIDVVKRLGREPLEVLGGVRFNFKMGMRFTFSPRIHFHGMVDNAVKQSVIERSRGLIFPVRWHEPFGLAITESLYFGSPVFGTPYGSLPELVGADVGFLTDSATEMVEFLRSSPGFSPKRCHDYAVELFNSHLMAKEYLRKYETVLNGSPLIPEFKHVPEPFVKKLPWHD